MLSVIGKITLSLFVVGLLNLAAFGCGNENQGDLQIDTAKGSGSEPNDGIDTSQDGDAGGSDRDTENTGNRNFDTDEDWAPVFDIDPGEDQSDDTWTIMMYEAGDNNLEGVLLNDVNEMEMANIPDNVNVIVLIDRAVGYDRSDRNWKGAKLFKIEHDEVDKQINSPRLRDPDFLGLTDTSDNGEEIDMGLPETLENFIKFCQANFKADHYILHLSDHGDGWQFQIGVVPTDPGPMRRAAGDEATGNALTVSHDLPGAIQGKGIEAVTIDACLLGTVEVAWALSPHTDYTALSTTNVPSTGWQYTWTLNSWFEHQSAKNWVISAVREFETFYEDKNGVGLTAVDLSAIRPFGNALDAFVAATETIPLETLREFRDNAYRPDRNTSLSMRDFTNLVLRTKDHVDDESLDMLLAAYDNLILNYWYADGLERLKGLTIYAPGKSFLQGGPYQKIYDETPFSGETSWDEFIKRIL